MLKLIYTNEIAKLQLKNHGHLPWFWYAMWYQTYT